jgi:hypothetical protein
LILLQLFSSWRKVEETKKKIIQRAGRSSDLPRLSLAFKESVIKKYLFFLWQ